ncbi:MAG: GNAT family N-acetyltransferase [Devosia sp.]|nr:GNAT family N-acetyltransferase [Devosia sp.]
MGDIGDLLVRLYDLPQDPGLERLAAAGIEVRRALPPERLIVLDWVTRHFGSMWAAEVEMSFSQHPVTIWLAVRDGTLFGFACHDATAKGFFGPTGVDEAARGQGIGEALLFAALRGMREAGYAYAVIGDPGPVEFYRKRLDASVIPKSKPGLYRGMLRPRAEDGAN